MVFIATIFVMRGRWSPAAARADEEAHDAGVAPTQAFTNAASAAAEHTPHVVMDDALALADTIRSRQVSCVEVMTEYLDHIEKINAKMNAIVALQGRGGLLAQASERAELSACRARARLCAARCAACTW